MKQKRGVVRATGEWVAAGQGEKEVEFEKCCESTFVGDPPAKHLEEVAPGRRKQVWPSSLTTETVKANFQLCLCIIQDWCL